MPCSQKTRMEPTYIIKQPKESQQIHTKDVGYSSGKYTVLARITKENKTEDSKVTHKTHLEHFFSNGILCSHSNPNQRFQQV